MSKKQDYDSLESQIGEMGSVQQEETTLGKLEHFGKSKEEILHDLFDTEYYLEHKDDKIKSLLYKKRS